MSNATLQVGGGNWAAQDGKLLGYAVEPTSGRYLAREFTVNRNSSKWVLGSDGYLYEVPADQPALEYYSDGTFRGALVEPQSVNLCLQSEDFSTTWGNGGNRLTITTNSTTAPDGTTTADEVEVTTTGILRLSQTFTGLTAGDNYTFSFFAKKSDSGNIVTAFISNNGETKFSLRTINLDTLSVSPLVGFTYPFNVSIRDYRNGWIRIECKTEIPAGETSIKVNCLPGSEIDATATGANAFFWGAQVEQSPIATSYIPTTTGAVTRLKDDISFTNASSVIGQSEGTLFVEVDWQSTGSSNPSQTLFEVNDSTANNRIVIYNNAASSELRMLMFSNGSTINNQGASSSAYSGIQKIAFAYKQNDCELYRNGSSISTNTSVDLSSLATLTDVEVGKAPVTDPNSNNFQANMWIRDARIYNTRLTDTQCQDLTSLDRWIFSETTETFSNTNLIFNQYN